MLSSLVATLSSLVATLQSFCWSFFMKKKRRKEIWSSGVLTERNWVCAPHPKHVCQLNDFLITLDIWYGECYEFTSLSTLDLSTKKGLYIKLASLLARLRHEIVCDVTNLRKYNFWDLGNQNTALVYLSYTWSGPGYGCTLNPIFRLTKMVVISHAITHRMLSWIQRS